jgi:hypothetical protein
VHDERVGVVAQALDGGGVTAVIELVDECLEALSSVALLIASSSASQYAPRIRSRSRSGSFASRFRRR